MKKTWFPALVLLVVLQLPALAQIKKLANYPPVILTGSQLVTFKSAINHNDYTVAIQLPGSYKDSVTSKYPVLYVLDGQWSFAPTLGLLGGLNYDALVPEVITVAIGWPDKFDSNRTRDLTPTITEHEFPTGGGPKFFDVIKNEIKPFVNANYRTDPANNILSGGSYGGLFVLYSLFRDPGMFNSYIVGSPSVDYDNNSLFKTEQSFASSHRELNARIFFHWGKYESDFDGNHTFEKFLTQIKNSNYKGLAIGNVVVDKMAHASNGPYGAGMGLQFVLEKPDIKVSSKLLEAYAGRYEQDVLLTHEDDALYLNLPGIKTKMHAANSNLFYVPGLPGTGEFVFDDKGKLPVTW